MYKGNMFQVCMPFFMSDPCLFYACSSKFEMHAVASLGAHSSQRTLKHKGIAMRTMAHRIANFSGSPSDELIASAICLTETEVSFVHEVLFQLLNE
jgi:hypothetical protein